MQLKLLYAIALLNFTHKTTAYDYKVRNDTNTNFIIRLDISGDNRNWNLPAHTESGLIRKDWPGARLCLSDAGVYIRKVEAALPENTHPEVRIFQHNGNNCGDKRVIIKYGTALGGKLDYYYDTEALY